MLLKLLEYDDPLGDLTDVRTLTYTDKHDFSYCLAKCIKVTLCSVLFKFCIFSIINIMYFYWYVHISMFYLLYYYLVYNTLYLFIDLVFNVIFTI